VTERPDEAAVRRTVEAVWRMESGQLIASLTRLTSDVGLAEELAQDALVAALEQWSASGVPVKPGAWLMTTARRRAIDQFRRNENLQRKTAEIGHALAQEQAEPPDWDTALDQPVRDDLLRLIFIACHPVLSREARVALTLKMLGGLSTPEIARAFLVPEATVAQRIVRAKKTLSAARVPFEVPTGEQFTARLTSVLEVIYLVFNEGYSATAGEDVMRPALVEEALRLARVLAELAPREPEVHGLAALLEIQASRVNARTRQDGTPVLLLEQDRSRWDWMLVGRGLVALDRAERIGAALGPYGLQASIAACHARAREPHQTDWQQIAALYEALAHLVPTPVVELNRAVAVGMAYGPAEGLELLDRLSDDPALARYHLLPSARADLLRRLGRWREAQTQFERAASLTRNERERRQLLALADDCRR
jgi:RNA polymerase sigma factor (sigma-70 family)